MNNMLIDYGWSSPFQDYLPQNESYTEEITINNDEIAIGGIYARFTTHGNIEAKVKGKTWFNIIGGDSVVPLDIRTFQSLLGHRYYDVINNVFIDGDGTVITITNNTDEDQDMAVYDLTLIGMDTLTLEEAGENFLYEKDIRGISADIEITTTGSGKSSKLALTTATDENTYINSIPNTDIVDEIHITRFGECLVLKKVGEQRDVVGLSLINFEDMKEGGRYIAYLLSGAYQEGVKGETLESDAVAIHYELGEVDQIEAEYEGEILSFGPGTTMFVSIDNPGGLSPSVSYSAPIDSTLLNGLDVVNSLIMFGQKGELYNKSTLINNEKQYEIRATFVNQNLDKGLILWYNKEIGKVKYTVNNNESKAEILTGENSNIRKTITKNHEDSGIVYPALGEDVTLSAKISGNNIRFYINETEVISMEQRSFQEGYFGIHADQGAVCREFSIESIVADEWVTVATNSCMVDCLGGSFILKAESGSAHIQQSINVEAQKDYTLSFYYAGDVAVTVRNSLAILQTMAFSSTDTDRAKMSFLPAVSEEITIEIGSTNGSSVVEKPMLEEKPFATSYAESQRELSQLTFPADRVNLSRGAIGMAFSPMYTYGVALGEIPIFHYNDQFNIRYSMGKIIAKYGEAVNEISFNLNYDEKYYIYLIWDNSDRMTLGISTFDEGVFGFNDVSISSQAVETSSFFYIGSSLGLSANILIDALAICDANIQITSLEEMILTRNSVETLRNKLETSKDDEEIKDLKAKISDFESIVIRTGFDKETLVYNRNKISVPTPKAGSNIIVTSSDGAIYERVCFIDDNNEYDVYHKEKLFYYGDEGFELSFGDILDSTIEVFIDENGMILEDVETKNIVVDGVDTGKSIATIGGFEYYNILTQTIEKQGEFIGKTGLTFESAVSDKFNFLKFINISTKEKIEIPYEYVSLSSDRHFVHIEQIFIDENIEDISKYYLIDDFLYGEPFEFRYTVKDTFCINYDKEHNQYDIKLSNIGSEDISIIYEEEAGIDNRLIRTVEINPFKSTANTGFIYIKDEPVALETFDIKITPDSIMANGYEDATLVIDCLGRDGHPTSYVDLDVISRYKLGEITKYEDPNETDITDEHRAGRFIYKYRAKPIDEYEKTDKIIIKDKISKIGIQVPIRLVRE